MCTDRFLSDFLLGGVLFFLEATMPNRVIREGFLDSEKINKLSESEQNFFTRLMLIVDDYGRFDARPELLKSKCYPVTDKRLTMVSNMLTKLNKTGLVKLYSVNGKDYLEIVEYNQRLRQKREKYPSPESEGVSNVLADVSNMSVESNPKELESEEEKNLNPKPNFEIFWRAYHLITGLPKTDKDSTIKYFNKLSLDEKQSAIDNISQFFESLKNKDFCKKARTYLSDKNFNDEFKPAQKRGW